MKPHESLEFQKSRFPNAVWFFGDPCPIGTEVITSGGDVGTVVGPFEPKPVRSCHCPACTCTDGSDAMNGWWIVELRDYRSEHPDGAFPYSKMGNGPRANAICWPPALKRAPTP